MKFVLILSIIIAIAGRGCKEDNEDDHQSETLDEVGYVAEDVRARRAVADWIEFRKDCDSTLAAANEEICRAVDRIGDANLYHDVKFVLLVRKAELQLESLNEKIDGANRFTNKKRNLDGIMLDEMEDFKENIKHKLEKLNETLLKIRSPEFDTP